MIRCLITDRRQAGGVDAMLDAVARARVEYIQVREKDLPARELLRFTRAVAERAGGARVLVNGRADVAIAAGVAGVHLPSDSPPPFVFRRSGPLFVSVACHTVAESERAEIEGADLIVFAPVFGAPGKPAAGIDALRAVARAVSIPVLALGGVDKSNARQCLDAGAAGIAGIRLFLR